MPVLRQQNTFQAKNGINKSKSQMNYSSTIEVIGDAESTRLNFKRSLMHNFVFLNGVLKIFPDKKIAFNDKCTQCHSCERKCPVNAIKLNPFPECNHKECIKCLCCIEICPNNAVYLADPKVITILKKILRRK